MRAICGTMRPTNPIVPENATITPVMRAPITKTTNLNRATAILCLVAVGDGYALTGGDDGKFLRTSLAGDVEELADFGTRWVDCVAASHGHLACSSGKEVHVWTLGQSKVTAFEHASTVGGLAFARANDSMQVANSICSND